MLGAEGVLLGTRFLATDEAPIPAAAKAAICDANEADTIFTPIPDLVNRPAWLDIGAQARAIRTRAIERWLGCEAEPQALDDAGRRAIDEGRDLVINADVGAATVAVRDSDWPNASASS